MDGVGSSGGAALCMEMTRSKARRTATIAYIHTYSLRLTHLSSPTPRFTYTSLQCSAHPRWNLPKRPRKRWFDLYNHNFMVMTLETRKKSDDLLIKVAQQLTMGDKETQVYKLIERGEQEWDFDVNYTSGSVLDRNGALNYAVIKRRKNVVKYLVDVKGATIETADVGGFTPLLNAVYNDDLQMVRFFLSRGANKNAVGTTHSSQGFKQGFEGRNAEGWARSLGYAAVADEIKHGISKVWKLH